MTGWTCAKRWKKARTPGSVMLSVQNFHICANFWFLTRILKACLFLHNFEFSFAHILCAIFSVSKFCKFFPSLHAPGAHMVGGHWCRHSSPRATHSLLLIMDSYNAKYWLIRVVYCCCCSVTFFTLRPKEPSCSS